MQSIIAEAKARVQAREKTDGDTVDEKARVSSYVKPL
jgi:hypothetical protein